eukprot:4845258-Prorocentrum_lima.AAC.1
MTSSLVGSEMCIRDSHREQIRARMAVDIMEERNSSLQARMEGAMQKAETVSYTHLTLPTICSV